MLQINGIKLRIDEDETVLKDRIEKKLHGKVKSFSIRRKSLDARKEPVYVYSVLVETDHEEKHLSKDIVRYVPADLKAKYRPRSQVCIIAGYGPSGIFAAYRLMEAGFRVVVFEKGKRISERQKDMERFFKEGIQDEDSNANPFIEMADKAAINLIIVIVIAVILIAVFVAAAIFLHRRNEKRKSEEIIKLDDNPYMKVDGKDKNEINSNGDKENTGKLPEQTSEDN